MSEVPKSILQPILRPTNRNGQDTSREAAAAMIPWGIKLREKIWHHFVACGERGSTDDEGELALGAKHQSYTPDRKVISDHGYIEDSGRRRATRSGRPAIVWVLREDADFLAFMNAKPRPTGTRSAAGILEGIELCRRALEGHGLFVASIIDGVERDVMERFCDGGCAEVGDSK